MREESGGKRLADCQKFTLEDVRQILVERGGNQKASLETKQKPKPAVKKASKKAAAAPKANGQVIPPKEVHVEKKKSASIVDILGFNPFETEEKGIQYDRESVPRQWRTYFDRLIRMRDELDKRLSFLTKETLHQGNVGDSDMPNMLGQHAADGVAQETNLNLAHSFVANEQELLSEVNAALERIRNNAYGICQQTGEKISTERLAAQPYARFSIAGQLEHEAQRKKQTTATVGNLFQIADGDDDSTRDMDVGESVEFE
ncbi:MAG: TraR/DksA family transcriptional regulator [Puniceicoccales bacterium]|nr:TraR/DksA family transcriptional regulator [Puniceicoccales bacterium]